MQGVSVSRRTINAWNSLRSAVIGPHPQPSPASTSNAARSNPGIAGTIYFANENENENENEKENEKRKRKTLKPTEYRSFSLFFFLVLVLILSVAQCVRRAVRLPSSLPNLDLTVLHSCGKGGR